VSIDDLRTGVVVRYPYLWLREAVAGETEGRKSRPAVVGVRLPPDKGNLILFIPITSRPPQDNRLAVEIPAIEKRRAGLDLDLRLWIVFDEYNEDVVGRSFHLLPDPPLGAFSKAFFLPVMQRFIAERQRIVAVNRR
jgi:hypothetical protein